MKGPVVLIVDDDPLLIALVQHKLTSRGYTVATASDGEAGLECARALSPDVIVLDIMMPVLDGRSVLQRLREDPRLSDVPVVMLTAHAREEDIVDLLQLGASDYLVKPFSPEELAARIGRLVLGPERARQ
jgi:DNA-binding response OmpR family regulator